MDDEADPENLIVNDEDLEEIIELEDDDDKKNSIQNDDDDDAEMIETTPEDESILSFDGHQESVFCCDVSNDDQIVVTGGQDDKAIVWGTNNGQIKFQTNGHKDSIVVVKFNCNSTMIATGDYSGVILVWNLNGTRLYDFEVDNDLNWLQWHPQVENVLLAGTREAWMWRLSQTNPQSKIFPDFGCATTVSKIFNDGKRIAMGYEDGSIRIWDLKEVKVLITIQGHQAHTNSVTSLDINSDDTLVASGSEDSTVKILNVNNQKILDSIKLPTIEEDGNTIEDSIESLAFSARDSLVIASLNGSIQVWHLSTKTKRNEIKLPAGVSKIMVDKHNTNILYAGCLDSIFRVLDLRTCEIILTRTGHRDKILDFQISSDSKYALTCSDDSTCKIFKLTNG